ncbi:DUF6470 family protein [Halobacillus litoralis]|uniref:DUF6470 family protein n=1 Tax=Halobacillus litoralis TaxID=45668 RepID=UPI001CD3FE62|nr:DUF6470 family protein [Halobacillus litoralis]MCA0971569.1 DUF6470 family protein [Halobacillus litoralis]
MSIPKLQVQTQQAQIGLQTVSAKHEYKQFKAEQSIQQPKADMTIEQKKGKLTIDQSSAWSNLGFKSIAERTRDTASHAEQVLLEGIARVAQEGDEMMSVENNGNPIPSISERNTGWDFNYPLGSTPVSELVKLSYQANPAKIQTQINPPVIEATPKYPEFNYERGYVDISLVQHASIQIDWKI